MRIVQLNLAADFSLANAETLLDRYHTLTGWSRALTTAGAHVAVVQRFTSAAHIERDGIAYTFVEDDGASRLSPWEISEPAIDAVTRFAPDVVHVNGLMFPATTQALRATLGDRCAIVLQDHSGTVPLSPRPIRWLTTRRWEQAFRAADACTFTAAPLAARWHEIGLPPDLTVIEITEASTSLEPVLPDQARAVTGMNGAPAILWVGRLDANKDPLTVLTGIEAVIAETPAARVWMLAPNGEGRDRVLQRVRASDVLRRTVSIMGPVPYDQMPLYYSSSDIFVSGSHHEGSGYALIEAMACGLTPCVTDIPAFRALVGSCGILWTVADSHACSVALKQAIQLTSRQRRDLVRADFAQRLSWQALGRHTLAAYTALVASRRARR